jgi:hypothetical protein
MEAYAFSMCIQGVIQDIWVVEHGTEARHVVDLEFAKILNLLAYGDASLLKASGLQ